LCLIAPFLIFAIYESSRDDFPLILGVGAFGIFAGNFFSDFIFGLGVCISRFSQDDLLTGFGGAAGIALLALLAVHWSVALPANLILIFLFVSLRVGGKFAAGVWLVAIASVESQLVGLFTQKEAEWVQFGGLFYPVYQVTVNFMKLLCAGFLGSQVGVSEMEIPAGSGKLMAKVGAIASLAVVGFGVYYRSVDRNG